MTTNMHLRWRTRLGAATRRGWRIGLVLAAVAPARLAAGDDVVTLLPPRGAVAAGQPAEVTLLATNGQSQATPWNPPATLPGRLSNGGAEVAVRLETPAGEPILIRPGGFASRPYRFTMPPRIAGPVVLEVTGADGAPLRAVLDVADPTAAALGSPATGAAAVAAPRPPARSGPAPEPAAGDEAVVARTSYDRGESGRTFAGRIAAHEPVYFVAGTKHPAAKFQFSFKYRLATFAPETEARPAQTLQFAYTQLSLWDIQAASSPFYDTSYMPELIYERVSFAHPASLGPLHWYGFQAGYHHESNGQAGAASRSLNLLFARPVFGIGDLNRWHLLFFPQAYAYVASLRENPDIARYRGYAEIRGVVGTNNRGPLLGFTERAGRDFNHLTTQVDLTFPVRFKALDTSLYFLLQYFRGYGESLRGYNERSEELRAGFSFVR